MCECKHRWAIRNGAAFLDDLSERIQDVFCVKCGKDINDLLDEKDRLLAESIDYIEFQNRYIKDAEAMRKSAEKQRDDLHAKLEKVESERDELLRCFKKFDLHKARKCIADRDATIASQERQLNAAANDMAEYVDCYDGYGRASCPIMPNKGTCEMSGCTSRWRKRWEEASKHG